MVLPRGTVVPPLPHLFLLVLALVAVGWGLRRAAPDVDDRTLLSLAPWMVAGAWTYVAYQTGLVPDPLAPLASSPTVYGSTAAVAGAVWWATTAADRRPAPVLAATGTLAALVAGALAGLDAVADGTLTPAWPAAALGLGVVLAAVTWVALRSVRPAAARTTGAVGMLAILGHALDAATTAVGVGVLGYGERTPLSRVLLEAGAAVPLGPLGGGWLFVLVKLVVAAGAVWLFADYVREAPTRGRLALGFVAAVGLGPGAHNALLFAVTQSP